MTKEASEGPRAARSRSQRRIDTLAKLRSDVDLWVASADEAGGAEDAHAQATGFDPRTLAEP
jgi:hypothetical protein